MIFPGHILIMDSVYRAVGGSIVRTNSLLSLVHAIKIFVLRRQSEKSFDLTTHPFHGLSLSFFWHHLCCWHCAGLLVGLAW